MQDNKSTSDNTEVEMVVVLEEEREGKLGSEAGHGVFVGSVAECMVF
jgi:hypothetical protein